VLSDNKYNLEVSGDLQSHLIDTSNLVDGKPVYYLVNRKDLVISPVAYLQVGYLALINCNNITVEGLTLTNNGQGLLLFNTNNSRISGNNITNNDWGILLGHWENSKGHSSGNAVQGNNIANNRVGIGLYYSSSNVISGNNIANNEDGIRIHCDSNNNSVSGNNVTNNAGGGIDIREGSSGTTVSRNNITNNGGWGVHLDMYLDGKFYHNNFINNTIQVHGYIHTSTVWNNDYPSGGNYWSDYTGADANGDGIGDMPYVVYILMYENVTDRYPLMAPFSMSEAGTWNNVTYYVDMITNSTVSDFNFDQDRKMINLNVTGLGGTDGFSRVSIPKKLLWCESLEEWRVHVIGIELPIGWRPTILEDDNYTYIYIPYWHPASYSVSIQIEGTYAIPEFPSAILLPLFMIFTLVAFVLRKKRGMGHHKRGG
jgi:parallel beta-helix repeat protein